MDDKTRAVLNKLIQSNVSLTRLIAIVASRSNDPEFNDKFNEYMLANTEALEAAVKITRDDTDTN